MKNLMMSLAGIIAIIVLNLTSCKKDNTVTSDTSVLNGELKSAQTSELRSLAYNDTLVMYWDTARVRRNNPNLIHYDMMYHHNDSLFSVMYNMFGGQMYQYGIMMNGYNSGGMMGNNLASPDAISMQTLRNDTTIMGVYYNNMMQLRINHQVYHNSIYY